MPTRLIANSCVVSFCAYLGLAATAAFGQATLPTGFSLKTVATGLDLPVSFVQLPDNRFYVTTKAGLVRVVNVDGSVEAEPFIDLTDEVNSKHDRGLLSIELHPDFPAKPFVYLLYAHDPVGIPAADGDSPELGERDGSGNRVAQLARVTADASENYEHAVGTVAADNYRLGSPQDKKILLGKNSTLENIGDPNLGRTTLIPSCNDYGYLENEAGVDVTPVPTQDCIPDDEEAHTVGTVRFGRDGTMFVTSGDGSPYTSASDYSLRAQRLNSLAGKLLRIDPRTGDGIVTNPYFDGDVKSNQSKVYALGMRSPFRMAVDPITGLPWVGDVGWNSWEEINTGEAGNFGWPCYEGGSGFSERHAPFSSKQLCQSLYAVGDANITPPFYAYPNPTGASIQLGDFYQGTVYPQNWRGQLFFSDINTTKMRALNTTTGQATLFADGVAGITEIRAGNDTNLYLLDIYNGQLKKLSYTAGGNTPPVAVINAWPVTGQAPITTSLSSRSSYDPDGDELTYVWDFGDGSGSVEGAEVSYEYAVADRFTATLTVTDPDGASDSTTVAIVANNSAPTANILSVLNQSQSTVYRVGDTISYSGSGSDPEDGELTGAALSWDAFIVHNAHTHPNYSASTGADGSFLYSDHEDNSHIRLCLTVTDSGELSDIDCFDVFPLEAVYSINSNPQGVALDYSGNTLVTPFFVTTTVGGRRTISAPSATPTGDAFKFWSFGGNRSQEIIVQEDPPVVVANFSSTALPAISQPLPGSILSSSTQIFDWSPNGLPVDDWKLDVGSAPGATDYSVGQSLGSVTTQTVSNLPQDGYLVYVRLHYRLGGEWSFVDFSYPTTVVVEPEPEPEPETEVPADALAVDVMDVNRYGFRFEGDECCERVHSTTFLTQATDLVLTLDGFDIDHRKEVRVEVNGTFIGFLKKTPDQSTGMSTFLIPQSLMIGASGINKLEFIQRRPGYSWGVTNILLKAATQPRALELNVVDWQRYGSRFDGEYCCTSAYTTTFQSQTFNLNLNVDGYDIDTSTEVEVFVNGISLGHLNRTPNKGRGTTDLEIPANTMAAAGGVSTLKFVKSAPGYRWGITALRVTPR